MKDLIHRYSAKNLLAKLTFSNITEGDRKLKGVYQR